MALNSPDPTKTTRFRGPAMISLRGASVHSPQTIGDGGDIGLRIGLPTGQTVNAIQIEKPEGTVLWAVDQNGNQYSNGVTAATAQQVAQFALSTANIEGMFAAPVTVVPAPAANQVLLIDEIFVQTKPGATQFTGGGAASFVYHGTAVSPHTGSVTAAQINAATAKYLLLPPYVAALLDLTTALGLGLDITNATGAFATGNGSAILTIYYSTVTLG